MPDRPIDTAETLRMPGAALALQAQGLTLLRGRRVVLRDLDFAAAEGEIVAILGANGAGKTTLLQCLAGVLRPSAGKLFWLGDAPRRSPDMRRRIGWLGHETGLYRELTARENLVFAGQMYGVDRVSDRAGELLAAVGLERMGGQLVRRLSLGMQRRLAIARAVIHDPPILLLDEPFANLDGEYRVWLAEFLAELRQRRRTICFTSHDPQQRREIADRLVALQAGRLQAGRLRRFAGESEEAGHVAPSLRRA